MSGERYDISFEDPTLNKMIFDINNDFSEEEYNGLNNMKYNLIVKDDISNEEEDTRESSLVIFNLIIGGASKEYPFKVEIEYQSIFHWEKNSSVNKETFLKVNAPAILYSYCRPIISNISNLSKYPSLNIPFYNFTTSNQDSL